MMRAVPTTMMGIQPIWGARGCTGGSSERLHRPRISHEARSICACAGWSTGAYLCEPERSTPQSDHVAGFRVARPGLSISAATDAERPHRRYHNTYHPSQRGLCAPRPPHGRCNQIQGCRALVRTSCTWPCGPCTTARERCEQVAARYMRSVRFQRHCLSGRLAPHPRMPSTQLTSSVGGAQNDKRSRAKDTPT